VAEKSLNAAPAMHDAQDKRLLIFDTVDDDILAHRQAAVSGTKIFLAGTSDAGEATEHKETVRDGIDQAIGDLDAAAFARATYTQMSSRSLSARGAIRCAISAGRGQFREKAGATAFFYFLGKLPHGFLCDNAAFSTGQGCPRIVKRQKKFSALPLAFFPQGKGFLHGVFFRVQASGLDRAARKSLLIRGKLYIHRLQNTGNQPTRQGGFAA
jgi:hypothetical protein